MIPLCTTAILPVQSQCGWAFILDGSPWVAHRVWPMPILPLSGASALGQDFHADGILIDLDAAIGDGDAAGIIAAVFQLAQAVEQNRLGFFISDISDDAAHKSSLAQSSKVKTIA